MQAMHHTQLLQQMPPQLLPYPGSALSYLSCDYVVAWTLWYSPYARNAAQTARLVSTRAVSTDC